MIELRDDGASLYCGVARSTCAASWRDKRIACAAILGTMRSVAGELREEQEREVLALTPGARVELALRLAEDGLRFFMETNRLDREAAIVLIRKQRSAGRVPSRCMDDLP